MADISVGKQIINFIRSNKICICLQNCVREKAFGENNCIIKRDRKKKKTWMEIQRISCGEKSKLGKGKKEFVNEDEDSQIFIPLGKARLAFSPCGKDCWWILQIWPFSASLPMSIQSQTERKRGLILWISSATPTFWSAPCSINSFFFSKVQQGWLMEEWLLL